ncbi:DNA-binding response regulator [Halarcobacter ebronensis]|uniref:DNA-binding response regulator n=1 Tax=Halarcobacter ebronensis TaxID=1462615 RepID=A0A4V1LRP5_9BACT|nr:response regulator [Halarcobacter ebronensis]RXJ68918.1 DNA-binding response regulator [Halarcobacter ebronensis]
MEIGKFKNFKLLYVEDEPNVRKYAMSYFNRIFEHTYEAANAIDALKLYKKEKPEIIITDIQMQSLSGIEFIKKIRALDKRCQIIILSAFLDTKYLLEAIGLNLVKYLTKPIKHDELYNALLECISNLNENNSNTIYFSDNSFFNIEENKLVYENKIAKLTQKELELLKLLVKNKNKITEYHEIEYHIWYDSIMSENALRLSVKKLRKKLPPNTLENIAKLGYKINFIK